MRPILVILFFTLMFLSARTQAQKWQPGHFTDVKGNLQSGLIRVDPSKHGPVKNEGFIEFKQDKNADKVKISAGTLQSLVVGKDSFVVTHAPKDQFWPRNQLDFAKVVLDEDTRLFASYSDKRSEHGSGFSGFSIGIGGGTGFGGRNFGVGLGGGVEVPISGQNRNGYYGGPVYYYGENTTDMKIITNENFADVMTDIMGDEPDVVNKIAQHVYSLQTIDNLVAYFNKVKAARKQRSS